MKGVHTPGTVSSVDVAVFGGGPAGLAAALALRQRGMRVAVYDAQRPPIDKACGEGLMPEAMRLLDQLGVELDGAGAVPFAGISFHDAQSSACAEFPRGPGLGVRRTHLQQRMAALAEAQGVVMHWGASVRRNVRSESSDQESSEDQESSDLGFETAGRPILADFFVIADGQCSTLAAASGFRERACHSMRYASRQHFVGAPRSGRKSSQTVEVHWGRHEQLYITPLGAAPRGEEQVGVALLTSRRGRKLSDALLEFPAVARRLADARPISTARGAVTRTRSLRQVMRGNVAVLGDASGSVDAVTGEGILSALRQADALADALDRGHPQHYAAAHRAMAALPQRMARLLLLLDRYPWLGRRMLASFAARPEIFAAMLRVHLGEQTIHGFALEHGAALLRTAMFVEPGASAWPLHPPQQERGL